MVPRVARDRDRVAIEIRVGRQRKPSGTGYLRRDPDLAEEERGIAVSTLGKVIHQGWDWLGIQPATPDVTGLVEIPALAESLTLNKAGFVRSGSRGATFLAYRKAVQEAVAGTLEAWGATTAAAAPGRRTPRSLERDLASVLSDLSEDYPLLATLVERTRGGQRQLPLGGGPSPRGLTPGRESVTGAADARAGAAVDGSTEPGRMTDNADSSPVAGDSPQERRSKDTGAGSGGAALPGGHRGRARQKLGLRVRVENNADDPRLGRLVESTVWVNGAHPAYLRAVASRSEGYHLALSVAMALADVAVEPAETQRFLNDFMAGWGGSGRSARRG